MTIHASAQWANVESTICEWFKALTIPGTPATIQPREERRHDDTGPFVRMSLDELPSRPSGHIAGATAAAEGILVAFDLFWPVGSNTRQISKASDALHSASRDLRLPLKDYSADPAAPVAVAGFTLRATNPPNRLPLRSLDGYERKRVSVVLDWHSSHS